MIFYQLSFNNFLLQYEVSSFKWFWNRKIKNEKMKN